MTTLTVNPQTQIYNGRMKARTIYAVMAIGAAVGMVASFLQTLEKLALLKNPHALLTCNINSVFSCSNVLDSWQSSVFGFPNSIMCLVLFTVFTAFAVAGWCGSRMPHQLRIGVQGLSLFTLVFGLWFLWQSTYKINALCIYCIGCMAGLLLVNWGWVRLNADNLPYSKAIRDGMRSGTDIVAWFLLAAIIAMAITLHFS